MKTKYYFFRMLIISSLAALLVFPVGLCFAKGWSAPLDTCHKHSSGEKQKKNTVSIVSGGRCLVQSKFTKRRPKPSRTVSSSASTINKKISSRSAIVMDAHTGRVLYSQAPDRPAQPASTIKILTGLISIRALRDQEKVKVSKKAAGMPRSKIYLERGKSYIADDLINAVLLASANDASVALAEKIAGSEKAFAKIMTYKAKELGANSTICKTASGLTSRGQQSTVRDLAVIFRKAMDDEEFARRIGKTKVRTRYGKLLRNHNKAMWRIKGAEGGKTGYTRAARQTYVGQFSRGEDAIVVAIMGSETMWDDIRHLVKHGFARKRQIRLASLASASQGSKSNPASSSFQPSVLDSSKKKAKL
ncbi:MAG: D-alanyl-D-alanine carboxypeptidase [Desulfobulbaceae bacterium]|nr:D-alanyl-D-alanine carboxypeptidase [Desulfobulbaceae bacterium]